MTLQRIRIFLALGALVLLASSTTRAAETEWPQFRGPTGQGISAAHNVPVKWDATTNVAWKIEVPGRGWSSPVLSRDRIYLTSAIERNGTGSDPALALLCFDTNSGQLIWESELFRPDPASVAIMHRKNSPASSTPIVSGERVYAHFGHMGTAAVDLSGKIVWRQSEVKYSPVHGAGGSPVLVGDALIFHCDGAENPFVIALDATTGAVRWKTARHSRATKQFSFATPLAIPLNNETQLISPASGLVAAYDPTDGRELWRVTYGEGYSVIPRPVYAHGLVFISSGFEQPVLYAIKPEGATGDVTNTHVAWNSRRGIPHTSSMLAVGDELYFVSDGGVATCADARTGKVHWNERLGGDFSASPFFAEGRIYFLNEAGITFGVKAARQYELLSKNELGTPTLASAAVVDGAVFIRSEKHLWKIVR